MIAARSRALRARLLVLLATRGPLDVAELGLLASTSSETAYNALRPLVAAGAVVRLGRARELGAPTRFALSPEVA